MVRSPGIEPGYQASQAWTLSVVLRARKILRRAILSIFSLSIPEKIFAARKLTRIGLRSLGGLGVL